MVTRALLCALLASASALCVAAAPAPPSAVGAPGKNDTAAAIAASQALSNSMAKGGAQRPAVTPLPPGKKRVCVFDFDDTLKNEGNVVAEDASWAVHAWCARALRAMRAPMARRRGHDALTTAPPANQRHNAAWRTDMKLPSPAPAARRSS